MKIVVVANTGWYLWKFRRRLMHALRDAGHEPVAVAPPDASLDRLAAQGIACRPLALSGSRTNPFTELAAVARLRRTLGEVGAAAAFTYTPKANIYTGLVARGLGIAHVPNVSGLGRVFIEPGPLTRLVERLYRRAFRDAFAVVFQNDDDRARFLRRGLARPEQARLVPGSGVDLDRYRPVPLPGADGTPPVFLFVGRLLRDKGVVEFADAARRLRTQHPGLRFRMLGPAGVDNPTAVDAATLARWANEGIVEWLGEADDVRPAIAQADCVVLPSYREGLPRVLLEAAAMGRPCIATDVPGCRHVVDDGLNGLLCTARDAGALARTIEAFVAMTPEQRAAMGARGRAKVEEGFDERLVLETYLGLAEAIARPPVRASASRS